MRERPGRRLDGEVVAVLGGEKTERKNEGKMERMAARGRETRG
jgi:hypothetical protein